jgi:hypothetical protein
MAAGLPAFLLRQPNNGGFWRTSCFKPPLPPPLNYGVTGCWQADHACQAVTATEAPIYQQASYKRIPMCSSMQQRHQHKLLLPLCPQPWARSSKGQRNAHVTLALMWALCPNIRIIIMWRIRCHTSLIVTVVCSLIGSRKASFGKSSCAKQRVEQHVDAAMQLQTGLQHSAHCQAAAAQARPRRSTRVGTLQTRSSC